MQHGIFSRALAWLAAATALLATGSASAATMYYLDVPGLVEASDLVVVGELVDARVFRGSHDRITTEWTVRVDATLGGEPAAEVRFRQWAGELDGIVQRVPGDAELELGERKVFFLRTGSNGGYYLTALSQSIFEIHDEMLPGGGIVTVPDIASGVLLSDGDSGALFADLPVMVPVSRDFDTVVLYVRSDTGPELLERGREVYTLGTLARDVRAAWEGR